MSTLQIGHEVVVRTSEGMKKTVVEGFHPYSAGTILTPLGPKILYFDCFPDVSSFPNAKLDQNTHKAEYQLPPIHEFVERVTRSCSDVCFKLRVGYKFNIEELHDFNLELKASSGVEAVIPDNAPNLMYVNVGDTGLVEDVVQRVNALFYNSDIL